LTGARQDTIAFLGLAAGLALWYLSPWFPLAIVGAVIFLVLAWLRLDLALVFVLVLVLRPQGLFGQRGAEMVGFGRLV